MAAIEVLAIGLLMALAAPLRVNYHLTVMVCLDVLAVAVSTAHLSAVVTAFFPVLYYAGCCIGVALQAFIFLCSSRMGEEQASGRYESHKRQSPNT